MFLAMDRCAGWLNAVADSQGKLGSGCGAAGGIEVWMITGDNERAAQAIAASIGITNVMAEVLPNTRRKSSVAEKSR